MKHSVLKIWMAMAALLPAVTGSAQVKNATTATVKVYGNCAACKTTIEKAGNVKKVAAVEWNKDSKIATLTYDNTKTSQDEILKRIALAGYDSEKFLAPDDAYAKLPGCCKYDRELKPMAAITDAGTGMKNGHDNHNHAETSPAKETAQNASQLNAVIENYFSVKDALVKTDAVGASAKAAQLAASIKAVEMNKLSTEEHTTWMKVMKDLTVNAERISTSKEVSKQREAFVLLSANVYELAKVAKQATPVYYQHCPMYNNSKGANWLSKENGVKNPYYGSQMLTCGSTVETLNK